jgi:transposase
MTLSSDDEKEILELRGRRYSHRKIVDRTGHSESTVRKYIDKAKKAVIEHNVKGLGAKKIAERLDYPLNFVDYVITEWKKKREKESELENARENLRKRAETVRHELARVGGQVKAEGILDTAWKDQRKSLDEQVSSIVRKTDEVDSIKRLSELQNIVDKVIEASAALCMKYRTRTEGAKRRRTQREKEVSDRLLTRLGVPWYPNYVIECIQKKLTVKTKEETTTIALALMQLYQPIKTQTDERIIKETWDNFVYNLEEKGWDYINDLVNELRESMMPAKDMPVFLSRLS